MKIIHLNHVALQVKDVAATTRFYEEVVGLKQIPRPDFGFGGAWFRLGVDQELHLIDAAAGGVSSSSRGDHFALMVDSIEQAADHLRAKGIGFSGPKHRPDGAFQIFLQDPDGHVMEFCTAVPQNDRDPPQVAAAKIERHDRHFRTRMSRH